MRGGVAEALASVPAGTTLKLLRLICLPGLRDLLSSGLTMMAITSLATVSGYL